MNEVAYKEKHQPDWDRLLFLSNKADVSPTQLTHPELVEFLRLHKKVSRDLAVLRTWSTRQELVIFLNELVGRVHCQLYDSPRSSLWESLILAVATAARTVRKRWFAVAFAAWLFAAGGLFSYGLMRTIPSTRSYFSGTK